MKMRKPLFTGACTALVTPFDKGQIHFAMMEKLLKRQMDAGIPAVVICGTTGESATLTDRERIELFQFSKDFCGEKCLIIAGTGSNCTSHAVELSAAAQENGADALLLVSPYYNKASEDGLMTHYETIASTVKIPMILYNVPSRTGLDIPVKVYKELAALPKIAGVKEASTDMGKILRIREDCPNDFYIWSGNDDLTVPVMAIGGVGVISVASNVLPHAVKIMTDHALEGRIHEAMMDQIQLLPLIRNLFSTVNPIPVKAAMKLVGYDCGECRLPLTSLPRDRLPLLKEAIKKCTA